MRLSYWTRHLLTTFAMTLSFVVVAQANQPVATTYHSDHRNTPKLESSPVWQNAKGQTGEALARAYLSNGAAKYGIPADLSNLTLKSKRESLLGTHYRFQQQIQDVDILDAQIIVSISKKTGQVYRAYNNTFPAKNFDPAVSPISIDAAYDVAWNRLKVHGDLVAPANAKLVWVPEGADFQLNWIVRMEVTAPYGGWEVKIDANNGRVVSTRDTRLYRVKDELTTAPLSERIDSYTGPVRDRRDAFAQADAKQGRRVTGAIVNGTGNVFDPDPRTTLQDDNLQDGSPASAFTAAYFTRNLLDITLNAGTYSLTGPWVDIISFDPPATPPSTTTDGNWTANRGVNSFNDALTYFQLDQNQRYIQSLGFTGATGIQEGPIGTDTDGFNGADNSFYQPGTNRMSFGHGCVDDNEDADVILHEYGHAINHDINSNFSGGDTGAMGEGFGDYWAGSYSWSTPNGATYHPEWVYSWDGHGTGDLCWPGRIMDALGALYVHTTSYGAHSGIPGGFVSDELWSTPLFQSLLDLTGQSVPRGEVDAIILEAQFGLGSGIKMRDMATSIIQAANTLHPTGPHAGVFTAKFLVHDIIELQAAELQPEQPNPVGAGSNGVADPGETVTVQIDITNDGLLTATAVSAVLTSTTPGVVIVSGNSNYSDIAPAATAAPLTNYIISIPLSHTCGDDVDLVLDVTYDDGAPGMSTLNATLGTGVPIVVAQAVSPGLAIPDNNPVGITSQMVVTGTGANVTASFNVDVNITHTWMGDLIVTLRSPTGTSVILHNLTGSSGDNVIGNYPGTLTPAQPLSALLGEVVDGTWELIVSDNAGQDLGTLNSWGINDVSGHDCEIATGIGDNRIPAAFKLHAASPNPFGAGTTIFFDVPDRGADVTVDVFDVAGRRIRTLSQGFRAAGTHSVGWNGLNDAGRRVGTGIYFYRLTSGTFGESRKVMLLR